MRRGLLLDATPNQRVGRIESDTAGCPRSAYRELALTRYSEAHSTLDPRVPHRAKVAQAGCVEREREAAGPRVQADTPPWGLLGE